MTAKKCIELNHPNLAAGWGCCGCSTYNGNWRLECKYCGHTRCDVEIDEEDLTSSQDMINTKHKLN
jgi:hypothetical protein